MRAIRTDEMRDRIAAYPFPCGGVEVVRASRGYTLYSRRTDGPVARLRPTGEGDEVQVLWWRGQAWTAPGDFGPLIMPLDQDHAARPGPRVYRNDRLLLDQCLTPTIS
jgi:hypothetical protein